MFFYSCKRKYLFVYQCVFNQTSNVFFQSKAGHNICDNFTGTDACRQHRCFLLDCRSFWFWCTHFRCFNSCFRFNGTLYNRCVWSLCSDWWNSSVWHHILVMSCCLKILQCCCICYNGWYIMFISDSICCSDKIITWDF